MANSSHCSDLCAATPSCTVLRTHTCKYSPQILRAHPLRYSTPGTPCSPPQVLLLLYFVPSGTPCSLAQVLGAHTHARFYHLCSGSQAENPHVHILAPCLPCSGTLCSLLLRYPMLTTAQVPNAHPCSVTPCSPFAQQPCAHPCSGTVCSPQLRYPMLTHAQVPYAHPCLLRYSMLTLLRYPVLTLLRYSMLTPAQVVSVLSTRIKTYNTKCSWNKQLCDGSIW